MSLKRPIARDNRPPQAWLSRRSREGRSRFGTRGDRATQIFSMTPLRSHIMRKNSYDVPGTKIWVYRPNYAKSDEITRKSLLDKGLKSFLPNKNTFVAEILG